MELRSAEEQVQELLVEYQRLCNETKKWHLPEISSVDKKEQNYDSSVSPLHHYPRADADFLAILESLRGRLNDMTPKMDRFRKRLEEKDPITETPRYGEQTASRVNALLTTYNALNEAIGLAFGESENGVMMKGRGAAVVTDLRLAVAQQEEAARQVALEQEELRKKQDNEQKAEKDRQLQERLKQQEEARLVQAREEAELAQRAREARAARDEMERRAQEEDGRMRQEAERIDREWMDSITKGPDGVREQLQELRASTSGDAHQTALTALYTLFSQIVSHPEEVKFRRVRRDHARFYEEIGQHSGGRELLIAAGFRPGTIDDVPCFISTEPDIEKEIDAWSEWFDLLKATLELLEKEILK